MKNILLPIIMIIFIILIIFLLSYYRYINIREGFLLNNVDNSIYVNDNIDNINDIYKSSDTDNTDNKRLNTYVITSETMVKSIDYMKITNKLPKNILGVNTDNFKLLIDKEDMMI